MVARETRTVSETRQPERVIVGFCPKCKSVVLVENHHEMWPLANCHCGWTGTTMEIARRQRFENGGLICT